MAETLFQKVWNAHTVRRLPSGQTQLFVGLHLIHEVTTPQAFDMLRQHGWRVAFPDRTFGTVDHIVPTDTRRRPFVDLMAEEMTTALERNCREFGIHLAGPGEAGGFHKGTESVTTSAQDVGSGVQSIVLAADGQPIETYNASCNFTFAQPCPLSTGAQTLTLATTGLSDGTHTLTLVAIDAAGNQSTVASEQIAVDNNPPPPPIGLAATAPQVGGSTFTASWTDPSGQVAPITAATYQVCPASGSGACSALTAAPAAGPATVTVPGPGSWSLAVWLTDAAGNGTAANAAHTALTVPAGSLGGGGSGGSGGGGSPTPNATIHVSETLRGRELVVHVSGPATGRVRVSFTGRLGGRTVASGAKTVALKHGGLTATFKLGPRTAAHATIRVSARLDHQLAVSSTLHRHPRRSKPKRERSPLVT